MLEPIAATEKNRFSVQRVLDSHAQYPQAAELPAPWEGYHWPVYWISHPQVPTPPFVAAYRLKFSLEKETSFIAHVSADERYELFLNGERVGRGPTRGDLGQWCYESFHFHLEAGQHVLVARVASLGDVAPLAQFSARHGFLFAPETEFLQQLGTGHAPWESQLLGGFDFAMPGYGMFGAGAKVRVDGTQFDWGAQRGGGERWEAARRLEAAGDGGAGSASLPLHRLVPSELPAMLEVPRQIGTVRFVSDTGEEAPVQAKDHRADEAAAWTELLHGKAPLTLPPSTKRRVIVDLDDYYCAYPELVVSGGAGATVKILWAESLFETPKEGGKGDRDAVEGKFFRGEGAIFRPDGGTGRLFETLWWECGRYIEFQIETGSEALVLERFTLLETRYPLEDASTFECSTPEISALKPVLVRSLQMCAHETYVDCPYYEQLQYIGDVTLQALAAYPIALDARLPRAGIRLLNASRSPEGFTQSRYPSRDPQFIPTFSPAWVHALHNHALWRGDYDFVREMMPGVRATIEAYLSRRRSDGLIQGPRGWNFFDWVDDPAWKFGVPPDATGGVSGLLNWHFVWMLRLVAELETWMGEGELAARAQRIAAQLAEQLMATFWNTERAALADDMAQRHFSQHTQAMALLSGQLSPELSAQVGATLARGVDGTGQNITVAALFFQHHIFEALREIGLGGEVVARLSPWVQAQQMGVKCTLEDSNLNATRSDCHGWTAHPLFHFSATILGVRPASFGFESVQIAPHLGDLRYARGTIVHPNGEISVDIHSEHGVIGGEVVLPPNTHGQFHSGGLTQALNPGRQSIELRPQT